MRDGAAGGSRNGAGDLAVFDAVVGTCLRELMRLAVHPGGGGPASFAIGEALIDTVAVRLVGDDDHAAVGESRHAGEGENTQRSRGTQSHGAPKTRIGRTTRIRPKRYKSLPKPTPTESTR